MKMIFDPITQFLSRSAWFLWATLWISLFLGMGQEELRPIVVIEHDTYIPSLVAAILLWSCVTLQAIRQVYYSHLGNSLVKVARWIILGATTIFAFRMTYMLTYYGGAPSSIATLVGVSLLAIGLGLNAIGMMQQSYFETSKDETVRWHNSWRVPG